VEELTALLQGFSVALSGANPGWMLLGLALGIAIGVLPGLGGPNGVAILLPLTFSMEPTSAIILLSCIYWGTLFGGAITSILFNIPGESSAVATTFDGYPMAQQGRAAEALTLAFTGSFLGALFSVLLITFLAPLVARFALRFGPAEYFAVYFLSFASFIGMNRDAPLKTAMMALLGFGLAAVGLDTVSGELRMTFGSTALLRGVDFLTAVIGLFGIAEILVSVEEGLAFRGRPAELGLRVVLRTWAGLPRYWATLLRSWAVGCWMGITPGGATAASFMGYGLAQRFAREPERFGRGAPEGVLAPETAAHAAGTSALLPMLALGIPGSATAAVLLGGLMIWGLQPGPLLFTERKEFVWGLIASMYLGNAIGLLLVLATVPLFAAMLRVPFAILAPLIVVLCAIGAYTVHGALFDVWLMLGFGAAGYALKKLGFPLAPLVLALVLGEKTEDAFRQALIGSRGSLSVFWSTPLVGTLSALGLGLLLWPLLPQRRTRAARAHSAGAPPEPPLSEPVRPEPSAARASALAPGKRRAP
jgi:putative tricarboxylic transport membrane protein